MKEADENYGRGGGYLPKAPASSRTGFNERHSEGWIAMVVAGAVGGWDPTSEIELYCNCGRAKPCRHCL